MARLERKIGIVSGYPERRSTGTGPGIERLSGSMPLNVLRERVMESKSETRRVLAALPMREKLRYMETMREAAVSLRAARLHRKKGRH